MWVSILMKPSEGDLVGSFARGFFLLDSQCLNSNYLASRPSQRWYRPCLCGDSGGKTCYLSELKTRKEILVVD
ncbi:putative 3-dehydroquinate synthase II [Helianthus annuus]|nr:putative 3-dehydroquinate synthase II [Helianthus annuus]